jgi:hypothetical protein
LRSVPEKILPSIKQANPRDMFQKASKSAFRPVVSYSINFFSYEDTRKHKRTPMTQNQQMKEILK